MSKASRYLAAVLLLFCASVQAQVAVGREQLISSTGTTPSVAVDARGSFTVVWADYVQNDWGIFGQAFPANGEDGGLPFLVSSSNAGPQTQPQVAAGSDGRFTVVWQDGFTFSSPGQQPGGDGDGTGVFARIFRPGGVPQGDQLPISRSAARHQLIPAVAMGQEGSFVAAWQESIDDRGEQSAIVASRFSSAGSPVGPELRMKTEGLPGAPLVAVSPQGFAVGWTEVTFCAPNYPRLTAAMARFDLEGRQVGGVYRLAGACDGHSNGSILKELAASRAGFLAVFSHIDTLSTYSAQRFSPRGEPVGSRFTLPGRFTGAADGKNDLLTGLALDDRGRFVITWETVHSAPAQVERVLSAQVFSPRNRPLRKAFTIGTGATHSAIALANDGSLLIAWQQVGDPPASGLKVRRFRIE